MSCPFDLFGEVKGGCDKVVSHRDPLICIGRFQPTPTSLCSDFPEQGPNQALVEVCWDLLRIWLNDSFLPKRVLVWKKQHGFPEVSFFFFFKPQFCPRTSDLDSQLGDLDWTQVTKWEPKTRLQFFVVVIFETRCTARETDWHGRTHCFAALKEVKVNPLRTSGKFGLKILRS